MLLLQPKASLQLELRLTTGGARNLLVFLFIPAASIKRRKKGSILSHLLHLLYLLFMRISRLMLHTTSVRRLKGSIYEPASVINVSSKGLGVHLLLVLHMRSCLEKCQASAMYDGKIDSSNFCHSFVTRKAAYFYWESFYCLGHALSKWEDIMSSLLLLLNLLICCTCLVFHLANRGFRQNRCKKRIDSAYLCEALCGPGEPSGPYAQVRKGVAPCSCWVDWD